MVVRDVQSAHESLVDRIRTALVSLETPSLIRAIGRQSLREAEF